MAATNRWHFPRISHGSAWAQNQLTHAYHFPFTLGGESGALYLLPADASSSTSLSHWHCALGSFSLGEATTLLNLLSLSPFVIQERHCPDEAWQIKLFNQYLSPELALLFGHLTQGNAPTEERLRARLQVRLGDHHAMCALYLSHTDLAQWLKQPGWQTSPPALPNTLIYEQPLVLGYISLHTPEVQALRTGDVLVPPVSYFTPDGKGSLILGGQRLYGELQLPHHFLLNHLESTVLKPHATDELNPCSPSGQLNTEDAPPLAALQLSLDVRCGRTRMTLGELQLLQAGSILTLDNIIPGTAGLYHGDTLIAQGELVDVEGNLGLQLTRLLLNVQQEA